MGNLGRYVCVAVPFLMTLASLATLLAAGLGGVADKNMYMFQINTTNLTVSASDVKNLLKVSTRSNVLNLRDDPLVFHDAALLGPPTTSTAATGTGAAVTNGVYHNKDLGVENLYDIGFWGYCFTSATNGTRICTQTSFNWAQNTLNQTEAQVNSMITATGFQVTLPSNVIDGVHAFETAIRWTEIVFIIACIALGVELFFGFLANCSRIFSCITWLVAGFATVATCATAALATATSSIVVGVIKGEGGKYGVDGSFNTKFLAIIWISAAFAIGAGLFWIFTCCCCALDHSSRRKSHRDSYGDREKLVPAGAYVPISHDNSYNAGYGNQQYHYASGGNGNAGRRDMAYEPFAHHSNV